MRLSTALSSGLLSLLAVLSVATGVRDAPSSSFDLTLTWEKGAPDGVTRDMILVNGQFPGPPLRIRQGDDVTVTVHNEMPFNTSLHFHGGFAVLLFVALLRRGAPILQYDASEHTKRD